MFPYTLEINDIFPHTTDIHGIVSRHCETCVLLVRGTRKNDLESYHWQGCRYVPKNPQKRVEFHSIEAAERVGYSPCRTCKPKGISGSFAK